jgi:hypothetical protein
MKLSNISVSLFNTRPQNIEKIIKTYQDYEIIDEILIVSLKQEKCPIEHNGKVKWIYMPKESDLGLLSRYTFALSCKNRAVLIQDDDWLYDELQIKGLLLKNKPMVGFHPRWFYDNEYQKQPPEDHKNVAPILLTCGVLIDTMYLPATIQQAKLFYKNYQNVFNGEDIFMSRSFAYSSGEQSFSFVIDGITPLDMSDPLWEKNDANRTEVTDSIYKFFEWYPKYEHFGATWE